MGVTSGPQFFLLGGLCDRSRAAYRIGRGSTQRDNEFRGVEHQVLALCDLTTSPGRKRHWRSSTRGVRGKSVRGHGQMTYQNHLGLFGQHSAITYNTSGRAAASATAGKKGLVSL